MKKMVKNLPLYYQLLSIEFPFEKKDCLGSNSSRHKALKILLVGTDRWEILEMNEIDAFGMVGLLGDQNPHTELSLALPSVTLSLDSL